MCPLGKSFPNTFDTECLQRDMLAVLVPMVHGAYNEKSHHMCNILSHKVPTCGSLNNLVLHFCKSKLVFMGAAISIARVLKIIKDLVVSPNLPQLWEIIRL